MCDPMRKIHTSSTGQGHFVTSKNLYTKLHIFSQYAKAIPARLHFEVADFDENCKMRNINDKFWSNIILCSLISHVCNGAS